MCIVLALDQLYKVNLSLPNLARPSSPGWGSGTCRTISCVSFSCYMHEGLHVGEEHSLVLPLVEASRTNVAAFQGPGSVLCMKPLSYSFHWWILGMTLIGQGHFEIFRLLHMCSGLSTSLRLRPSYVVGAWATILIISELMERYLFIRSQRIGVSFEKCGHASPAGVQAFHHAHFDILYSFHRRI